LAFSEPELALESVEDYYWWCWLLLLVVAVLVVFAGLGGKPRD
jgi:hypothetical protein